MCQKGSWCFFCSEKRPEGPAVMLRKCRLLHLCSSPAPVATTTGASAIVTCLVPGCRGAHRASGHPRVLSSSRPSPKITFTFYSRRGTVPGTLRQTLLLGGEICSQSLALPWARQNNRVAMASEYCRSPMHYTVR